MPRSTAGRCRPAFGLRGEFPRTGGALLPHCVTRVARHFFRSTAAWRDSMKGMSATLTRLAACVCATFAVAAYAGDVQPEWSSAAVPQMGFNNWNSTHCRDEFNEDM